MYFYYMVAALGPKYQKYIWWKKYLTAFQMVRSSRCLEQVMQGPDKSIIKSFRMTLMLLWQRRGVILFFPTLFVVAQLDQLLTTPPFLISAAIRGHLHPPVPAAVHRLQLPEGLHGVDRPARRHVPVPVLRLLQASLQQTESSSAGGRGTQAPAIDQVRRPEGKFVKRVLPVQRTSPLRKRQAVQRGPGQQ